MLNTNKYTKYQQEANTQQGKVKSSWLVQLKFSNLNNPDTCTCTCINVFIETVPIVTGILRNYIILRRLFIGINVMSTFSFDHKTKSWHIFVFVLK